jgi:hypothetical protein
MLFSFSAVFYYACEEYMWGLRDQAATSERTSGGFEAYSNCAVGRLTE